MVKSFLFTDAGKATEMTHIGKLPSSLVDGFEFSVAESGTMTGGTLSNQPTGDQRAPTLLEAVLRELNSWDRRFDRAETIAVNILDIISLEIEEQPTSASLYESADVAKAVTAFKLHVADSLRKAIA